MTSVTETRSVDMQPKALSSRLALAVRHYYDTGFTYFGGPPVHFHLLYKRYVEDLKWIDDRTARLTSTTVFQELFAVAQALPGPASTKLAYGICLHHLGTLPALLAFLLWCLPGALGMYGLSLGVARIGDQLAPPVYNLLSGLNAATVGLIALAGMQLSKRAITDGLSRTIVIFSACAGLSYTALWYFPILMAIGAVVAALWDLYLRKTVARFRRTSSRVLLRLVPGGSSRPRKQQEVQEAPAEDDVEMSAAPRPVSDESRSTTPERFRSHFALGLRAGITIVVLFFVSFITLMILRSTISPPLELKLFSNLYLAGTIIFGGGPVVIPLLREYVVDEGWVSARDFLIGLAVIQAFPGPNFNYAVYLASLASQHGKAPSYVAAVLGLIAIFLPGIALMTGVSSFWRRIRHYQLVTSSLRGINAAAIGLIWTAVYRLWEAGYLTEQSSNGQSLGKDAWWLVVAAVAFCSNEWYGVPAAVSILIGGVLGIARWGVIQRS